MNSIRKQSRYLWYVIKHKWFVFIECAKIGLVWRGLLHDIDKFRLDEFLPYANYFGGNVSTKRDKTGYYNPAKAEDPSFRKAWFLHQKRNRHHWQWWIMPTDTGELKIFPMDNTYVLEMISDWRGAGRAQGNKTGPLEWYTKNINNMILHEDTRRQVEELLGYKE